MVATFLGAGQAQLFAQQVEQADPRFDVAFDRLAIDGERQRVTRAGGGRSGGGGSGASGADGQGHVHRRYLIKLVNEAQAAWSVRSGCAGGASGAPPCPDCKTGYQNSM